MFEVVRKTASFEPKPGTRKPIKLEKYVATAMLLKLTLSRNIALFAVT